MNKKHTERIGAGKWKVGQIYTYLSKETCIRVANKAIKDGFEVEFMTSLFGHPAFKILDPFEKSKKVYGEN